MSCNVSFKKVSAIKMAIPSDILDDICFRFLVNLPEDQKRDPIRVCFQAELAHWFYVDFYCRDQNKYPNCREVGMREFIRSVCIFHIYALFAR